jgi:hypothetical protein
MGRGRKTGSKLSDKHKQNIATARRQIEQGKRNTNLNSFKRSLFAQAEAAPAEIENPTATTSSIEEDEEIASASDTNNLVVLRRTHEPQQIVPNLDVLDDDDFHNDDDISDGDPLTDCVTIGGVMHTFLQATPTYSFCIQ